MRPEDLVDEHGEVCIELAGGYKLYSGWLDHDDPDALVAGDYLRLESPAGEELAHVEIDTVTNGHYDGKQMLGRFLIAVAEAQHAGSDRPDADRTPP